MRKCLKRSVVLLLLLTLCLTANVAINTPPAKAAANEIMVFPYPRPADNNRDNWGKEAMSFMGGWALRATDYFSVFSNDYSGKIYYCIEPGQYIKTGDSYTEKDEFYWLTFPSNSTISSDKIKLHIGRIFQYGYIGKINLNWTSQNDADTLGNVIATQILIWETVVGERDSEFNHVAPGAAYDAVLDIVTPSHPVYTHIMKNYNRIVNAMQAHLDSPSFMSEERPDAQTVELKWNGTEYTASLTDTNNVLSHYDFEPDNTNVKVTVSGNKLILTSKVAVKNVMITAIRTLKRSGLITWSSSTRQDIATYSAEVSDPLQAFIKIQTQQTGTIKGLKVDENGKPLAGALIGLFYGNETNLVEKEAIKKVTTGADGVFEFKSIPYGKYIIKEIKAPNNYLINETAYKVELSMSSELVEIEIENELMKGNVNIIKTSTDGNVKDIEFTLTGGDLTTPLKGKTDSKGSLTFSGLKPGTYTVTETVPNKYQEQRPQTVTITAGQTATVSFSNVLKTGSISGLKVDENNKPLAGALIGLFYSNETNLIEKEAIKKVTTGENGVFEFKDIPYGDYIVKELQAPTGYILNETLYPVSIKNHGDVINLEIVNKQKPATAIIFKISEDKAVEGIEFTITGGNLTSPIIGKTDANGTLKFEDLQPGTYTITETTPDKYVPQTAKTITLSPEEYEYVTFYNTVKKGSITGLKTDSNNKPLAGAVIGLFGADVTSFTLDTAINTVTTGENGAFEFKDIPYGEYIVREIEAPVGYVLNENLYPVKIENHGDVIELEIVNEYVLKTIEILKTDTYSNPLAGAIFTLETSIDGGQTWEILSQMKTKENGKVSFRNLAPGILYRVTETKAPDGFQMLSAPVFQGELEVSNETKITFTVVNSPIYELPSTGGNSFVLVTISISLALSLCTFLFLKKRKVSEYKNN